MNVEAQVTWTDGERFVANASSGHGIVIDSDRQRNTAAVPWKWPDGPMRLHCYRRCQYPAQETRGLSWCSCEGGGSSRHGSAHGLYFHQTHLYGLRAGFMQGSGGCGRAIEEKYCSVSAMLKCTAKIVTEVHLSHTDTVAPASK